MSDKITISFDDEEKNNEKVTNDETDKSLDNESMDGQEKEDNVIEDDDGKLVIDFEDGKKNDDKSNEAPEEIEIDADVKPAESLKDKILNSEVDFFYRGNSSINSYFPGDLKFPEGIESGFRRKFFVEMQDVFLNSILLDNEFIVLASKNGNVYFIDRFTGLLKDKVSFDSESFERTGLVYKNKIFVNSVTSIFHFDNPGEDGKKIGSSLYTSDRGYYIWSSLNRYKDMLLFLEYSPQDKKANLKFIDTASYKELYSSGFEVKKYINDSICVLQDRLFCVYDDKLLVFDLDSFDSMEYPLNIEADENSVLLGIRNRLFLSDTKNDFYSLDLSLSYEDFKFSGINNHYVNSSAGFGENIFIGTDTGWKYYKSNGIPVYIHEDVDENKVEAVCDNILVVSKNSRVIFHNLNRFQEAEGFIVKSKNGSGTEGICSVVISEGAIFVLTYDGVLSAFTNDKLNIHV